jgi:hypothetical protein
MRLIEALQSKGGAALLDRVEVIKGRAAPFLARITDTFPEYTSHDISHADRVIANLDWLIPDACKETLNEYEIFFLLVSCYLHDVGMFVAPRERAALVESCQFRTYRREVKDAQGAIDEDELFRDFVRRDHHRRSESFIKENWSGPDGGLGFDDEHQAHIVGRICLGHREEDLSDARIFRPQVFYGTNLPVRVTYLAGLLRIADALDITMDRVPLLAYRHVDPRNRISRQKWDEHKSVMGVGPAGTSVEISCVCTEPQVHRALNALSRQLQAELDHVRSAIAASPDLLDQDCVLPYTSVVLDIEEQGYKAWDLKFRLSDSAITTLLMGEHLYQRRDVAVRELLQNSLDACRQRRQVEAGYVPEIAFSVSDDGRMLTVQDNGIGMTERQVQHYFAAIGRSFYQSPDFLALDRQKRIDPVSQFGIGILSCFLIADAMVVETRSGAGPAIRLEIDSAFDFFTVRDAEAPGQGTSVQLWLKHHPAVQDITSHLVDVLRAYAAHVEIAINVKTQDGLHVEIEDSGYGISLSPPPLENAAQRPLPEIKLWTLSLDKEATQGLEGKLCFSYVTDASGARRPRSPSGWHGPRRLSQLGIAVPAAKPEGPQMQLGGGMVLLMEPTPGPYGIRASGRHWLPEWLQDRSVFYDVNLSGERTVSLDVTRDRIVWDERAATVREAVETLVADSMSDYLDFLSEGLDPHARCQQTSRIIAQLLHAPRGMSAAFETILSKLVLQYETAAEHGTATLPELTKSGHAGLLVVGLPSHAVDPFWSEYLQTATTDVKVIAPDEDSYWFLVDVLRAENRKLSVVVVDPKRLAYRADLINEAPPNAPTWLLGGRAVELVDFQGPGSKCYIGRTHTNWFLLNRASPLVALMIRNPDVLDTPDRRQFLYAVYFLALEQLSRESLVIGKPSLSLERMQELHGRIIEWYLDAGLTTQANAEAFQLSAEALPWYQT